MKQAASSGRRYAQAVMLIAQERQQFDQWRANLEKVAAVTAVPDVRQALDNPKVPFSLKKQLLEELLRGVDPMAANLAFLLAQRSRSGLAADILQAYEDLLGELQGVATAEVATAVPLEEAEKSRITKYLSELTGKKISLAEKVDPGIIGGVLARVGDTLIDGTIRSRLAELRRSLA